MRGGEGRGRGDTGTSAGNKLRFEPYKLCSRPTLNIKKLL